MSRRKDRRKEKQTLATLSQWQLIGMRFRKHKLAVVAKYVLVMLYFVAIFAEFIAPNRTDTEVLDHKYCPPQLVRFSLDNGLHTRALKAHTDEITFRLNYVEDAEDVIPLGFFVRGDTYKFWGLFETDRHFFGVDHDRYKPPPAPRPASRPATGPATAPASQPSSRPTTPAGSCPSTRWITVRTSRSGSRPTSRRCSGSSRSGIGCTAICGPAG